MTTRRVSVWIARAFNLALVVWVAYAVITMAADVNHLGHVIDSRRYLDCVLSPAGDELLCKQVTVSDPPYQP